MNQCPKCHGILEDDGTCACGYGVKRRAVGKQEYSGPSLCSWYDHGADCPCRGIINSTGQWYCREHWERLQGLAPGGNGNYVPEPSGRSLAMKQWDGWFDKWKARRDRKAITTQEVGPEDEVI